MKSAAIHALAAAAALCLAAASPPARAEDTGLGRVYPRLETWDLDAVVGAGPRLGGGETLVLGRVRAGVLFVREPHFWSLGLTGEIASRRAFALGVEGGLTSDSNGTWVQLGASRALTRNAWSGHVTVGWTLVGVELRGETGPQSGWQVLGVLRLPVGIVAHLLRMRGRHRG